MPDSSDVSAALVEFLRQLRAWTPTIYRACLYLFATLRQVPFIGTLAAILAGYFALLFVWRTVTSTIRTAIRVIKWTLIVGTLVTVWSSVSSGENPSSLLSGLTGHDTTWISNLFTSQSSPRSSTQRDSSYLPGAGKRSSKSSRRKRNTSSWTDDKSDSTDLPGLPDGLADVLRQANAATQWFSGDTMDWLKEQWQAIDAQAQEMNRDIDKEEKRKTSWF